MFIHVASGWRPEERMDVDALKRFQPLIGDAPDDEEWMRHPGFDFAGRPGDHRFPVTDANQFLSRAQSSSGEPRIPPKRFARYAPTRRNAGNRASKPATRPPTTGTLSFADRCFGASWPIISQIQIIQPKVMTLASLQVGEIRAALTPGCQGNQGAAEVAPIP